jgi:hypothetical protein
MAKPTISIRRWHCLLENSRDPVGEVRPDIDLDVETFGLEGNYHFQIQLCYWEFRCQTESARC